MSETIKHPVLVFQWPNEGLDYSSLTTEHTQVSMIIKAATLYVDIIELHYTTHQTLI